MTVTVDKIGITFEEASYDITWNMLDNFGIDHWLNILSDKTWFTPAVESDFIAAVGKHYNRRG